MGAHVHVRDFDISVVFVTIYEPQSVEALYCALQEQTRFVSCFVALQGPIRLLLTAAVGWLGFMIGIVNVPYLSLLWSKLNYSIYSTNHCQ